MKKQVIRLTENDLQKIIKESVKRIIREKQVDNFTPYSKKDREENFKGLTHGTPEERNPSYAKALQAAKERMAKKKGSKKNMEEAALNELDPRTYASYADKRQAQADSMPSGWEKDKMADKATQGRYAATNAWNSKYGQNTDSYNGFGDRRFAQRYMQNDDYTVHDNNGDIGHDGSRAYITRQYNPKDQTIQYDHQRYDTNGNNTLSKQGTQKGDWMSYDERKVANQMQNGNGQYIKGQGWK